MTQEDRRLTFKFVKLVKSETQEQHSRPIATYVPPSTLDTMDPLKFFPTDGLLQHRDVITYDAALKACLAPMVTQFDPRDTEAPMYKGYCEPRGWRAESWVPTEVINTQPERVAFTGNLIHLVCDLHVQGDLISFTCSG
ncbi:hypothetical protein J3R83DRAFT_5160 [Lanmaoa asiatica]|nr:hypothetical protein J3R83DRAFT_5160 [Lanmaoa asiatica]